MSYTRATTANENGEVQQQDRPYGLNEDEAVGPSARSYDHQIVGVDAHGNLKVSGATRSRGTIDSGHQEIVAVRDANYASSKTLGEASPDDVVELRGLGSMTIQSAINAGWLPRDVLSGAHAAPQPAPVQQPEAVVPPQQPQEAEQAPEGNDSGEVLADEAVEQIVAELAAEVDPGLQQAVIEQAAAGDLTDEALVEAGGEKALAVRDAFEQQGREAFAQASGLAGESLQEFIDGVQADDPEGWNRAVQTQLRERSTRGYTELVEKALGSVTANQIGSLPEGVTVTERDGKLALNIQGRTLTLAEAIASGVVKLA